MWAIWWGRSAGRTGVEAARRKRFNALVRFARTRSRLYRDAYGEVPESELDPAQLPVMTRHALMSRFDDWVTDRAITLAGVEAFLADRTHIGEPYLDRYVIWKSSGTTGEPGIYVQDDDALGTYQGLIALQLAAPPFVGRCAWGAIAKGGRAALIAATGDHFASIASWERVCRASPWINARGFSVLQPLPGLVAELNAYQPAFLASYPTMLSLLGDELKAGRLRIAPELVWSGGEYLSAAAAGAIERSFCCPVINEYGASECMSIAVGCREGWMHVNADWVVLEPVDAEYRPVPSGEPSATVLVTNLANRVQPVIRYDLGDSVIANPETCHCGNPLPAILVEGRRDDVVSLCAPDGHRVRLLPLALTTVIEDAVLAHRFQLVQTGADQLCLRLDFEEGPAKRAAWHAASKALRSYLDSQSLPNVGLAIDARGPVSDAPSGKLREVIVATSGHAG
jgi:phenylacetate-coenzyme A ligase PaaK-like adenylate-forming protein